MMMATFSQFSSRLIILAIIILGQTSAHVPKNINNVNTVTVIPDHPSPRPWFNDTGTAIVETCDAFYFEYMEYAAKFMHCELQHAVPFRVCGNCVTEYTIAKTTFYDLLNNPNLDKCRHKYISADRIQVIPRVQRNIELVWMDADCSGCTANVTVQHDTKIVEYNIPKEITKFLHLFANMTACVNQTTKAWSPYEWSVIKTNQNGSAVCTECLDQYTALNNQFTVVSNQLGGGDVCMDLLDMMNYTRHNWSLTFECSHRGYQGAPTIATSSIIALVPLFIYIAGRITSIKPKQVPSKQKRLTASTEHGALSDADNGALTSLSYSYAGDGGTSGTPHPSSRMRRVL